MIAAGTLQAPEGIHRAFEDNLAVRRTVCPRQRTVNCSRSGRSTTLQPVSLHE
jgi:hypothetical protein